MKKADRKAEIVTAGIPESTLNNAVSIKKYIPAMYRAGLKKAADTIAFNAYANDTKDLLAKLRIVRRLMNKAGDKKAPIWITEIGWASAGNKHRLRKGLKGQAREITRAVALIKKQRTKLKLRGFVYYQWQDTTPYRADLDPGLWGFHAGLFTKSGKAKPAYKAFKKAVARL
jgi:hypothetical protein